MVMRLPNVENAVIDIRKLTGYVLDVNDARGRHKARVFSAALGFTVENAEELKIALLDGLPDGKCIIGEQDFYGQRYTVDCKIKTKVGEALVRTGWMIRRDEDFPRFTTCFVKKERRRND